MTILYNYDRIVSNKADFSGLYACRRKGGGFDMDELYTVTFQDQPEKSEKIPKRNNPDGEKILGTHIHIYTEEHEMAMAIPFDVNNKDLYQLCYTFFDRFNIIDKPKIKQQLTLSGV